VSRVDTQVDQALATIGSPAALALRGKIAIANAKAMYRRFQEIFHGDAFSALRSRGARVQRPLWASTGTKNPAYSDVLYVEELVGRETVNTLPPKTLAAFRDHGHVRGDTVLDNWPEAESHLRSLSSLGINLDSITDALQVDGVRSFAEAYDKVVDAIGKRSNEPSPAPSERQTSKTGAS
jgi:transaldolase